MHASFMYIVTMILLDLWSWGRADLFSAISDLEPLLETQKRIIDDLDDYIVKEERRLAVLKKHFNIYKREQLLAMEDISNYLGNPMNALTLIKRLTLDLNFIEDNVMVATGDIKNKTLKRADALYPSSEDLVGSVIALNRLQDTYLLNITKLSEGTLDGGNISSPFTASDCYEIGRMLYNEKDYYNSLQWMKESLRKLNDGDELFNVKKLDLYDYISYSHYLLGNIRHALDWGKRGLLLEPTHLRLSKNVMDWEKTIREIDDQKRINREVIEYDEQVKTALVTKHNWTLRYEALCRGEIEIPGEIAKELKCSYLSSNHPFLKLAPIKMEQLYFDPDVRIFHQVVSDGEIEHVKNMGKPYLQRTMVFDESSNTHSSASYRISKSAWLGDYESQVVARITQRVADFTGLCMRTAEKLQLANYGVGGHYVPHVDFVVDQEYIRKFGIRVATVLFYMSDVPLGGATVFTHLGLTVYPTKGSALFWMNLLPSGHGNHKTEHAACPVLRGSKWASNKWINLIGQKLMSPPEPRKELNTNKTL